MSLTPLIPGSSLGGTYRNPVKATPKTAGTPAPTQSTLTTGSSSPVYSSTVNERVGNTNSMSTGTTNASDATDASRLPPTQIPAPVAQNQQVTKVNMYRFPSDLGSMAFEISLQKWDKLNAFASIKKSKTDSILLPMPARLTESLDVGYKQSSLGAIVGGVKDMMTEGMAPGESMSSMLAGAGAAGSRGALHAGGIYVKNKIEETATNAINSGKYSPNIVETLRAEAIEVADAATNLAEQAMGTAINPNLTLLLSGPSLRRHEFSWTLVARSRKESEVIKAIIDKLRRAMMPSIPNGFIYKYPNYALLRFMPDNEYLYKFKPCVITGMNVDYAAGGQPSFFPGKDKKNNPPTVITLQLSFQELEVISAEDFDNNDYLDKASSGYEGLDALQDRLNDIPLVGGLVGEGIPFIPGI